MRLERYRAPSIGAMAALRSIFSEVSGKPSVS
jgi:hypothetical protein